MTFPLTGYIFETPNFCLISVLTKSCIAFSTQIRKACAEQVYLVLLQNENLVSEEKMETALEIISETCWDGDMEAARLKRLELYDTAGLDTQLLGKTSGGDKKDDESQRKRRDADENASYSSLVGSSGF